MPPVSAPLTTQTANTGAHAQALVLAAQALDAMKKALSFSDPTTSLGQALAAALRSLGKEVGSPPESQKINSLQTQLLEAQRSAMQRAALQQRLAQGGAGGAPAGGGGMPAGGGAAAPQPPMAA